MTGKWKLYYSDGLTFCDQDGSWWEAPGCGLIVIAQAHPQVGREVNRRENYYWWREDKQRWFGGDHTGLIDYLHFSKGPQKIITGRIVSNDEFNDTNARAIHDPYFPPKSAWMEGER